MAVALASWKRHLLPSRVIALPSAHNLCHPSHSNAPACLLHPRCHPAAVLLAAAGAAAHPAVRPHRVQSRVFVKLRQLQLCGVLCCDRQALRIRHAIQWACPPACPPVDLCAALAARKASQWPADSHQCTTPVEVGSLHANLAHCCIGAASHRNEQSNHGCRCGLLPTTLFHSPAAKPTTVPPLKTNPFCQLLAPPLLASD